MKTHYSWETDEERDWVESQFSPTAATGGRSPRRLLLAMAGAAAVFVLLFFLADRRLQGREDAVAANVRASHETWEQAVKRDDLELFTTLLARDDAPWFMAQRRLFMAGRVLRRDALGLDWQLEETEPARVQLSGNWRRAEVEFAQTYRAGGEMVRLRLAQVFRLRGQRWQYAAPDESFWGRTDQVRTDHLDLTFPSRDEVFIRRLANDLEGDIAALCAAAGQAGCPGMPAILINFSPSTEALLALTDETTPALQKRAFVLPAPSLVGLPADDMAYRALYTGYTGRILAVLRNNLERPLALPDQTVELLCFPSPQAPLGLYRYDPAGDQWAAQPTERLYRSLQGLPDDSGIILHAGLPGTDVNRLDVALRRGGREATLLQESDPLYTGRVAGVIDRPGHAGALLLSATHRFTGATTYRLLPLESCDDGACDTSDLPGFPLWSPDGTRTLLLVEAELFLGDAEARPERSLGRSFSPFWLTDNTFGYVRLLGGSDQSPEMELVLQSAAGGAARSLARARDLRQQLDVPPKGTLRVQYVLANPADPRTLYLAATLVAPGRERFYVLRLRLGGDVDDLSAETTLADVKVALALDDLPIGDTTFLLPTGYPPFAITPDGRWLVIVQFLDAITNTWRLTLYDTQRDVTQSVTLNYPAYPARFPFYDWSADGQWLVLVDNGYLRLVAPAYGYERVVAHDLSACRYPAWVDREATLGR